MLPANIQLFRPSAKGRSNRLLLWLSRGRPGSGQWPIKGYPPFVHPWRSGGKGGQEVGDLVLVDESLGQESIGESDVEGGLLPERDGVDVGFVPGFFFKQAELAAVGV